MGEAIATETSQDIAIGNALGRFPHLRLKNPDAAMTYKRLLCPARAEPSRNGAQVTSRDCVQSH
jgi:hypothetical protein